MAKVGEQQRKLGVDGRLGARAEGDGVGTRERHDGGPLLVAAERRRRARAEEGGLDRVRAHVARELQRRRPRLCAQRVGWRRRGCRGGGVGKVV